MRIAKVRSVKSPVRGTDQSAGIDFFVPDTQSQIRLFPNNSALIPSGIHVQVPKGFMLVAMNKSGVATKKMLVVGAQVVDEDYQGQIHIHVINVGTGSVEINPGDKLVQFILIPVSYAMPELVEFKDLYTSETERGDGGFGSTGEK
jgi:dUTP pyrophosphatase